MCFKIIRKKNLIFIKILSKKNRLYVFLKQLLQFYLEIKKLAKANFGVIIRK